MSQTLIQNFDNERQQLLRFLEVGVSGTLASTEIVIFWNYFANRAWTFNPGKSS